MADHRMVHLFKAGKNIPANLAKKGFAMKMKSLIVCVVLFFCSMSCKSSFQKISFTFIDEPIDVVIPAIEKDLETLPLAIRAIRQYGKNVRNIYVVSPKKLTNEAEWFPEKKYPFSLYDVALAIYKDKTRAKNYLALPGNRIGWILQQFIKLYAPLVIPGISTNVLVLDADTVFLKPVSFLNERFEPLFNPAFEYHKTYFEHAARLLPGFSKVFKNYSGISHHMMFQKNVIEHLFATIESIHHMPAWQAMCHCIDIVTTGKLELSTISEYEIYFNYMFTNSDQGHIRHLKWRNVHSIDSIERYKNGGYDFISCHSWMRTLNN